MSKLNVGIILLAVCGVVFSANNQLPKVEIDVCFNHLEGLPTFQVAGVSCNFCDFDLKKTRSGQFVKTHLVYGDDPRVQRFIVPHKDHPETKLEFEVHFTEKQIKAQTKICTKARVLMHSDSNAKFFWLAIPFAIPFIIPAFFL